MSHLNLAEASWHHCQRRRKELRGSVAGFFTRFIFWFCEQPAVSLWSRGAVHSHVKNYQQMIFHRILIQVIWFREVYTFFSRFESISVMNSSDPAQPGQYVVWQLLHFKRINVLTFNININ